MGLPCPLHHPQTAALDVQPAEGLACLAAACYDALFATPAGRPPAIAAILGRPAAPAPVLVRLANHAGALVPVRAVKANLIGKLVALRGTVVRTGPVSPLVTRMAFACGKCGKSTYSLERRPRGACACGADAWRNRENDSDVRAVAAPDTFRPALAEWTSTSDVSALVNNI